MKNHTLWTCRPGSFLAFTRRKASNSCGNMLLSSRLVSRFAPLSLLWETVFGLRFEQLNSENILCSLVSLDFVLQSVIWSEFCTLEYFHTPNREMVRRKIGTIWHNQYLKWFSTDSTRRFRHPFHRLSKPYYHPRNVNKHRRGLSWTSKFPLWRNSSQIESIPELLLQNESRFTASR